MGQYLAVVRCFISLTFLKSNTYGLAYDVIWEIDSRSIFFVIMTSFRGGIVW